MLSIGHTLSSWVHEIPTRFWILSPGLENYNKSRCSSNNFPGIPHMSAFLENCWNNSCKNFMHPGFQSVTYGSFTDEQGKVLAGPALPLQLFGSRPQQCKVTLHKPIISNIVMKGEFYSSQYCQYSKNHAMYCYRSYGETKAMVQNTVSLQWEIK